MYIVGDKSRHRLLFYIQFSVYMVVYNARQEEVSKRRRNHVKALLYEPFSNEFVAEAIIFYINLSYKSDFRKVFVDNIVSKFYCSLM